MFKSIVSTLRTREWSRQPTPQPDWFSPVRALNKSIIFPYRYAQLTNRLTPFLHDVTNVLDVGASDGQLAHQLTDSTGCHITGIDVCLQPYSYIEVRRYNGRNFPFDDNAFDCVLMVDMLHHTTDIEQVLAEARRVARRFILIKDHYWDSQFDVRALSMADFVGNAPYGIPLPYNYLRLTEWEHLFHDHNLGEVSRATFRYNSLDLLKHIIVKLEVS
ncbi:MAG: class I SAM-dependent methyltransferase [Litorilinea sp.]